MKYLLTVVILLLIYSNITSASILEGESIQANEINNYFLELKTLMENKELSPIITNVNSNEIIDKSILESNMSNISSLLNLTSPTLSSNILASELISFKNQVVNHLELNYGYKSCLKILNLGLSEGNKSYLIDFDGPNTGKNPQQVYCDMNGGGWTLYANFGENDRWNNQSLYNDGLRLDSLAKINSRFSSSMSAFRNSNEGSESFVGLWISSDPVGVISFNMPNWATTVKFRWGNIYAGGDARVYLNGVHKKSITGNYYNDSYSMTPSSSNILQFREYSTSIVDLHHIWVK